MAVLAGCGFKATGQPGAGDDAPTSDAADADASVADALTTDGPLDAVDAAMADAAVGCETDADYTQIGGSRYLTLTSMAWTDGEAACEGRGSHLLVLDDALEATAIVLLLDSNTWLGVSSRLNDGAYHAVTDQEVFLAPGSYNANRCVRRKADATIESRGNCAELNAVVCECDGRAAVPGNF